MKKRDERLADSRLEKMGVSPKIYLFEMPVYPFRAITIADNLRSWTDVQQIIDVILSKVFQVQYDRSTLMKEGLHEKGIYGVSICEQRDQLNRQRGRTIAKGRLWKHLKEMEKENEQ